jgi:hypothetical protein
MARNLVNAVAGAILLLLFALDAWAQTLPLPEALIDLRSEAGEELLEDADAHEAFVPLSANFVTQKNQA